MTENMWELAVDALKRAVSALETETTLVKSELKNTIQLAKECADRAVVAEADLRQVQAERDRVHHKDSEGVEGWREFDSNGNLSYYKDSKGREEWYEYDSNGNLVFHRIHKRYA